MGALLPRNTVFYVKGSTPVRHFVRVSHFCGAIILYFSSNGRFSTPETLVLIDIDCHGRGTYDGAAACVQWLIDNGFPNLFWSRSTNGRGIHAYLRVDKQGCNARALDRALPSLERWLKDRLREQKWDVEDIEVKGRPLIIDWDEGKYQVKSIKAGTLAKTPVEAIDRPLELMNTTLKSVTELRKLSTSLRSSSQPQAAAAEAIVACGDHGLGSWAEATEGFGTVDLAELGPDWTPSMRDREWPKWCEHIARHGLQEEDTLGRVLVELAAWLYWVEMYGCGEEEIVELLESFVASKHNGMISGEDRELSGRIRRAVKSASMINRVKDKELFARVRQARRQGRYRRVIRIAPLLRGETQERGSIPTSSCLFIRTEPPGPQVGQIAQYHGMQGENQEGDSIPTSSCLFIRTEPLPPPLESRLAQIAQHHRMRRIDGVYPLVRFARQFLNALWDNMGSCRIHSRSLNQMAGGDPNKQVTYKKLLRDAGIIEEWHGYQESTASILYALTSESIEQFQNHSQSERLAI
jgi:hypothetical protein